LFWQLLNAMQSGVVHIALIMTPHTPPPSSVTSLFSQVSHGSPASGEPASSELLQSVAAHCVWHVLGWQTQFAHALFQTFEPTGWLFVQQL
jgi:hypothetical protein